MPQVANDGGGSAYDPNQDPNAPSVDETQSFNDNNGYVPPPISGPPSVDETQNFFDNNGYTAGNTSYSDPGSGWTPPPSVDESQNFFDYSGYTSALPAPPIPGPPSVGETQNFFDNSGYTSGPPSWSGPAPSGPPSVDETQSYPWNAGYSNWMDPATQERLDLVSRSIPEGPSVDDVQRFYDNNGYDNSPLMNARPVANVIPDTASAPPLGGPPSVDEGAAFMANNGYFAGPPSVDETQSFYDNNGYGDSRNRQLPPPPSGPPSVDEGPGFTQYGGYFPPVDTTNGAPSVDELAGYQPAPPTAPDYTTGMDNSSFGTYHTQRAGELPYAFPDEHGNLVINQDRLGHDMQQPGYRGVLDLLGGAGQAAGGAWDELNRENRRQTGYGIGEHSGESPAPVDSSNSANDYLNAAKLRDMAHGGILANDGRIIQGMTPADMQEAAAADYADRSNTNQQLGANAVASEAGSVPTGNPADLARGNAVNTARYQAEAGAYVQDLVAAAKGGTPDQRVAAMNVLRDMGYPVPQAPQGPQGPQVPPGVPTPPPGLTPAQLDAWVQAYGSSSSSGSGGGGARRNGLANGAMTDYEKASIEDARARNQLAREQAMSTAFDRYRTSLIDFAKTHNNPQAQALFNAGYLPNHGNPTKLPVDPMLLAYYQEHPDQGPAPGSLPPPPITIDTSIAPYLAGGNAMLPHVLSAQELAGLGKNPEQSQWAGYVNDMTPYTSQDLVAQTERENQQASLKQPTKYNN